MDSVDTSEALQMQIEWVVGTTVIACKGHRRFMCSKLFPSFIFECPSMNTDNLCICSALNFCARFLCKREMLLTVHVMTEERGERR